MAGDDLARFNAYLAEEAAQERADRKARKVEAAQQRKVDDAEAVKQRAVERVRSLERNPNATREEKAEADAAYREAVEAVRRAEAGEPEPESEPEPEPEPEPEA